MATQEEREARGRAYVELINKSEYPFEAFKKATEENLPDIFLQYALQHYSTIAHQCSTTTAQQHPKSSLILHKDCSTGLDW